MIKKKSSLDGPNDYSHCWSDSRSEPRYFSRRYFGGGSVMVWGTFSSHGKYALAIVLTRMESVKYIHIKRQSFGSSFYGERLGHVTLKSV